MRVISMKEEMYGQRVYNYPGRTGQPFFCFGAGQRKKISGRGGACIPTINIYESEYKLGTHLKGQKSKN